MELQRARLRRHRAKSPEATRARAREDKRAHRERVRETLLEAFARVERARTLSELRRALSEALEATDRWRAIR
jgi:hypothetical protein